MDAARLVRRGLVSAGEPFEAVLLEHPQPRVAVLFAAGAGGDPDRYLPSLGLIAARGCTVVAPRFERLTSPTPSSAELASRVQRLSVAFNDAGRRDLPWAGVGHSVGAALLLVLAGAKATTLAGEAVHAPLPQGLARLALMAPATDFFRAPGALAGVAASVAVWAGARDEITPPATAHRLEASLRDTAPVAVRVVADADHFWFMDHPPPHVIGPLARPAGFVENIANEVASFIKSGD